MTVLNGSGTLLGDHRVRIAGTDGTTVEVTGTDVVLAAGSVPRTIPGFDIDGTVVLTSDEVLGTRRAAGQSVAVIGGGVVGCEFASMFADLGHLGDRASRRCPTILNGVRRRRRDRGPCLQEAGHRRAGRGAACPGTRRSVGGTTVVSFGEGE